MNILILTASHPYKAAGVVALDLKMALSLSGEHNIKILTRSYDNYPDKSIISIHSRAEENVRKTLNLPRRIVNKLMRTIFDYCPTLKTDPNYYIQGPDLTEDYYPTTLLLKKIGDFKPDAIIVLFMPFFLTFKNLYELNKATKAPILLYLMDMAPMTGGCHYAWDCKGYQKNCGNCPAFFSNEENDQSRKNWEFKEQFVKIRNIIPIAASFWQWEQLKRSSLFVNSLKYKVFSPTNELLFQPGDKEEARLAFKIASTKKVVFFGSVSNKSKRKGSAEAIIALKLLYDRLTEETRNSVELLIAGTLDKSLDQVKFSKKYCGHLDYKTLSLAYQAATIFLNSSIEDSGPTMINQAIMTGTPVVAFEMGVAPDLVINGRTGYMAKLRDCGDLANGMLEILNLSDQEYYEYSNNCRNLGLEKCSHKAVGKEFENILKSLSK